jgi:hypothetical protein
MYSFDKTVNNILQKLLEEAVLDLNGAEKVVNSTINDIKKRMTADKDTFIKECEGRLKIGEDLVNNFISELQKISKSVNVEESFSDTAANAWDTLKQGGSDLWSKIAPEIQNTQEYLADLAVENMGPIVRKTIGDEYVDEIKNKLSENMIYKIIALLEPTGVMSWPYLAEAKKQYEAHIGTEEEGIYQLNLLAAQIAVIPGVRLPVAILTLPLRLIVGIPARVLGKVFGIVGLRKIGIALAGKIKLPFSSSSSIQKGANALENAPAKTKLGQIAKIPASNAIKQLPKKAVKAEAAATKKASQKVIDASKKVPKAVAAGTKKTGEVLKKTGEVGKKIAKGGAMGAKGATIIGSGDIPQTLKDWEAKGKTMGAPKSGTLGKFGQFGRLSTQSF